MKRMKLKTVRLSFGYKIFLFFIALLIAASSFVYSSNLINKLREQEEERIHLWADAYKDIIQTDLDEQINPLSFIIIKNNKTIPVIMTDENDKIISYLNLDSAKANDENYLREKLELMKEHNEPIVVEFSKNHKNYIYYEDSYLLTQLQNFPMLQAILVVLFVVIAYILLIISKKADDNLIWVGMSKETAHQLGTPISSLIAWVEMMKIKMNQDDPIVKEVEKDVKRLELITERFSRIGSEPKINDANIIEVVRSTIEYLKPRTSSKIKYIFEPPNENINVKLNFSLFQWVIENLCKNSIDAISGTGQIKISVIEKDNIVCLDISDTGKGMTKKEYKKIFKPGYTTKKYGWGLGLALVKRIVEEYHRGKIYVLKSAPNEGTTIRIELKST